MNENKFTSTHLQFCFIRFPEKFGFSNRLRLTKWKDNSFIDRNHATRFITMNALFHTATRDAAHFCSCNCNQRTVHVKHDLTALSNADAPNGKIFPRVAAQCGGWLKLMLTLEPCCGEAITDVPQTWKYFGRCYH